MVSTGLLSVGSTLEAHSQTPARRDLVNGTSAFRENRFEDASVAFGEAATDVESAALPYNQGCAL